MKRPLATDVIPSRDPAVIPRAAGLTTTAAPRWTISPRSRHGGVFLICCYVLWAFVIPIKNVLMIETPTLRVDTIDTETKAYVFEPAESTHSQLTIEVMEGHEIVALLRRVVQIVVGSRAIRDQLEALGSFDIDSIHHLVGPEDFHTLSVYYSLIVQATEFPGTAFIPRRRHFNAASSGDLPLDAVGLWVLPASGSNDPWLLSISCAADRAFMDGTTCRQNATSYVCYDFPVAGEMRSYARVSLNSSRENSGLGNNVALLFAVETFHATMEKLFNMKSWNRTLEALQFLTSPVQAPNALANGFSSVYHDGVPIIMEKFALDSYTLRIDELNTTTLESCFLTEIITHSFYTKAFVLDLVEEMLVAMEGQPYDAANQSRLAIPRDRINATMEPMLSQRVMISSGARTSKTVDTVSTKIFTGLELTSITSASAGLKLDKKLTSVESFGSQLRMLLMMARYPEYYSYYEHSVAVEPASSRLYDVMDFTLLGGAMSGLNTFKRDWWGNTMGVFKLAELPKMNSLNSRQRLDTWWDDEAKFAAWFQRLERSQDAPYYTLSKFIDIEAQGVVLDDNSVTRCHRAFYKTLVKIVWLSLLTASAQPSYLVFMSNSNGGARPWFVNMVRQFQLVGETMDGARYVFPYSSTSMNRKDDGSAWVIVPLLQAMLSHFGRTRTAEMILSEYNASFALFTTTEYGLVHFPDSSQCKVGFRTNNVSAETNTVEKITTAFYPSIAKFVDKALTDHEALYSKMTAELAADGVVMMQIPQEMVMGSPSAPNTIGFVGSPVLWKPTALTAGILKIWPAATPPPGTIEAYRNATVCYRTLELRYLNESVRCWVEPGSVTRSRVAYMSDGLRYLIWSNWSISWVLNSIALCIALLFFRRVVTAYRRTQFRCVSFWVAAQFNFQSVGVLSYAQVLLMTMSSVPLLVAYHLPSDPNFMDENSATLYPKYVRDVVVTLSATWFIRLGYDTVNQCIILDEIFPWVNNPRVRIAASAFVLLARVVTPDKMDDANYEMFKLLATCGISATLGVLCAVVPFFINRHGYKVAPTGSMGKLVRLATMLPPTLHVKSQNIVIKRLQEEVMPLNHHGMLGFSQFYGWSLTGLIMEGWEIVSCKDTRGAEEIVVTQGRCKIRLQVDDQGRITQCLL